MPGVKRKAVRSTKYASAKKRKTGPERMSAVLTRLSKPGNNDLLARGQYLKVNLKYSESITLNPGAGLANTYVFSANGCYDPNITGGGHQPVGFDQYMTLYELYTVTASMIKVTFINTDTANAQLVLVCNRDLSTTDADPRVYLENGATVWDILGRAGAGNDIKTIRKAMDMRQFSNNKDIMSEDNYAGTNAANPQEEQYYIVSACSTDLTTDTGSITAFVEITYETYFRQPRQAALS